MDEWAKFIIRHETHKQNAPYAYACCRVIDDLLAAGELSLKDLLLNIGEALRTNVNDFTASDGYLGSYGVFTDIEPGETNEFRSLEQGPRFTSSTWLNTIYAEFYERFQAKIAKADYTNLYEGEIFVTAHDVKFQYLGKNHVPLSLVDLTHGIIHFAQLSPQLWAEMEDLYSTILNPATGPAMRQDAAADFYLLLSQSRSWGMERGAATAARLALEYVDIKSGIERPPCKKGISLNMEAILSAPSEFREKFQEHYFDNRVSPTEIERWQKAVLKKQRGLEISGPTTGSI